MKKENRTDYKTEKKIAENDWMENGGEEAKMQGVAALRLFGALSGVEEAYLAACEEDAGKKATYPAACEAGVSASAAEDREAGQSLAWRMTRFGRRYGVLAAAVLCVALIGTGYYFRHSAATKKEAAVDFSGGASNGSYVYGGAAEDDFSYSGLAAEGAKQDDAANGSVVPTNEAVETALVPEGAEDPDGVPVEAIDESSMKSMPDAEEKRSTGDPDAGGGQGTGNPNTNGDGQGTGNPGNTNAGSLMDGDTESSDLPENEEATKEKTELDPVVDMGGLQGGAMEALTLEEARQIAVAGAYLPEVWPSSGRLESITATGTAGSERICVTWVYGNGWDSFFLTVRNLGKAVPKELQEAIADVSRPETYDVRLYEIPYADSVPEEYRATFLDPVFRREDFGKACVEARIKAYAGDSGDTGTPRGNFRVLYQSEEGDYVLVDFNGRGSVEEIRSMINSVGYSVHFEDWMKPEMP